MGERSYANEINKTREEFCLLNCLQDSTFAAPILSADEVHMRSAAKELSEYKSNLANVAEMQTGTLACLSITDPQMLT